MNIDVIEVVRWINLTGAVIAIIAWVYFYKKFNEPASIAPLTWLVNVAAYYTFRLFSLGFSSDIKNTYFLNLWSGLLHTHGIILLALGAILACKFMLKKDDCVARISAEVKARSEEAQ